MTLECCIILCVIHCFVSIFFKVFIAEFTFELSFALICYQVLSFKKNEQCKLAQR